MKDWRELLYERWDPEKSKYLSGFIATNERVFQQVFDAFYSENSHLTHRSGFILGQTFRKKPAVKNAAMRLLEFICKRNPELISEYKLYLDDIIENERPTLVAKAKKQMKALGI
jgi:hypothetical protein